MKKNKSTKRIPRNTSALAAKSRKGGVMKHRLEPKKGAKNEQAEILSDLIDEEDTSQSQKNNGSDYDNPPLQLAPSAYQDWLERLKGTDNKTGDE